MSGVRLRTMRATGRNLRASTVRVKGACEQVADLIALIDGDELGQLGSTLNERLVTARAFLDADESHRACTELDGFLTQVAEQRGERITIDRANRLMLDARRIKAAISS